MITSSLGLLLLLLPLEKIMAFSFVPPAVRTVSSATTTTSLPMSNSATASRSFEFPDDMDRSNGNGNSDSNGRGISSSELRRMCEVRQQRLEEEQKQATRFVTGDDLHMLRQQVMSLREELDTARQLQATSRVQELERAILKAQQVDAEFVYEVSLERMKAAQVQGRVHEAEQYRQEAMLARKSLPQFNLEGLWVGKYGDSFELINVTYAGDTLVAYKVTGDKNVPKGQVTFSVDLSPRLRQSVLEPIELGPEATQQWGSRYLSRFEGKGQVAAQDYHNSQWMEGQLILVSDNMSFAWLPIQAQVFFGRPSPELTLKLLRESRSKKFANDKVREHLSRCWEETEHLDDEMEVNGGLFRSHNQQDYFDQVGCFE